MFKEFLHRVCYKEDQKYVYALVLFKYKSKYILHTEKHYFPQVVKDNRVEVTCMND